ncbi:MAG: hypothetical protein IH949_10855 [Bacteroidetes bacterium]|nr:hypothetical protein [Bacteroidota bacterium]
MSEAKIEIKIGAVEFAGEGSEKWLETQLDKIISKAPDLLKILPLKPFSDGTIHIPIGSDPEIAKEALGTYLQEKGATSNQTKKFLVTAVWLESKGAKKLSTSDVIQALRDSSQKKLNNASLNLIQNVKKGFCEKDGDQFFVTNEGKKSL